MENSFKKLDMEVKNKVPKKWKLRKFLLSLK